MMLIFTFHKVLKEAQAAGRDFYTLPPEQLNELIESTIAHGYRNAGAAELPDDRTASGDAFLLTFDDGTHDHYEVVEPILRGKNVRGIFFISTAKLDKPGHLTRSQVRELAAAGHTIGSHSHEHCRLDQMGSGEIRRQLNTSCEILGELTGQRPHLFAPPGGFFNERIKHIAREAGFTALRTMRWGLNRRPDPMALECVPMNRTFTQRHVLKILDGRIPAWFTCIYLGKELLKSLVPLKSYGKIRDALTSSKKT